MNGKEYESYEFLSQRFHYLGVILTEKSSCDVEILPNMDIYIEELGA